MISSSQRCCQLCSVSSTLPSEDGVDTPSSRRQTISYHSPSQLELPETVLDAC